MTLWHLLEGVCFIAPISGAIASSSLAKVGFGGYLLALAIGIGLGVACAWTMFRAGRSIVARIRKQPDLVQERYFRGLYCAAILWIILALFIGHWVTAAVLRLAL